MNIISVILNFIVLLSTTAFSQYIVDTGFKPDVTFGEHNDRFDMSDLVDYQNKYFRADGNVDYRRRNHNPDKRNDKRSTHDALKLLLHTKKGRKTLSKKIKKQASDHINSLVNSILLQLTSGRRTQTDFAHHDNMDSDGGDVFDFKENLERFEGPPTRRFQSDQKEPKAGFRRIGTDPELLNYAFPVRMQANGFLTIPESDE